MRILFLFQSVLSEVKSPLLPLWPLKLVPSVWYVHPLSPDTSRSKLITINFCHSQSPKKVGEDIQKATGAWKGLKVTVKLTVINRVATVEVIPSASSLIIRELKEPYRDRKKGPKNIKHNGNVSLDSIIEIARTLRSNSIAREMSGTVKEILGTAHSIGCTVDGKHPRAVMEQIDNGLVTIPDV